jgi:hypothetical protein
VEIWEDGCVKPVHTDGRKFPYGKGSFGLPDLSSRLKKMSPWIEKAELLPISSKIKPEENA